MFHKHLSTAKKHQNLSHDTFSLVTKLLALKAEGCVTAKPAVDPTKAWENTHNPLIVM